MAYIQAILAIRFSTGSDKAVRDERKYYYHKQSKGSRSHRRPHLRIHLGRLIEYGASNGKGT